LQFPANKHCRNHNAGVHVLEKINVLKKLNILQLPKLISERRATAILGLLIITMLWAGVALKYLDDVRNDRREAERAGRNFAMVFEENVLRSIGEIDKALLYMRKSIEERHETTDLATIIYTTDVLSEIIVQVAIIDRHGIMQASNVGPRPSPKLDLSDREHYRVHVNSDSDKLFISKPLVGRASGRWSVQFTRSFLDKDKSFGGVVVASLNPEHFTNFYDSIDFGVSMSISLIGDDGIVRSSGGSAGGYLLGQDLSNTEIGRRLAANANVTFEDQNSSGEPQLVTLRRVRGYPLWVSVATNTNEIYSSSMAALQLNAAIAAVLTLIILGAMERILRTEAKARLKAEQLQLTLENMSQGIMLVTKDLQIPIINGRCGELLGLPAEFIKKPPRFDQLVEYQTAHGKFRHAASSNGREFLDKPKEASETGNFAVCERMMPNGTVIEVRSGHLPDGSFVQTFTDITKRWEAEAHVARLASEDPLTGLPNRRVFRSTLDQMIRLAQLEGGNGPSSFAVLFLDLDRFKVINDTLGHRIGDMLLQEVAKRLKLSLRPTDILARLGGDEFAIVVPSFETRNTLEVLASGIIVAIGQPYEIDGYRIRSSVSIGIAIGPQDGQTVDDILMAADLALYSVKAGTRGSFKFYERTMNQELNDRRQIETDLREALERGELELHYQPVINLRRGRVSGFEALARWRHPAKGMVPPALFTPVAEDSGLILPLGEWALREACRTAVSWPEDLHIAVNLSPMQFTAPNLVSMLKDILEETGLAPQRLELEITERIFMENTENTVTTLRRLKELGVRISLDDFGTGYSSLSYLRSFPFDKIKIDRAFVSDLKGSSEHIVIVQAVVTIARALGMVTTAEGVETEDQQRFLEMLGCDEGQGYLFSPPVPVQGVADTLAKWHVEQKKTMAA
jgi:diguanylate cyclase (GGDEF)-like protein